MSQKELQHRYIFDCDGGTQMKPRFLVKLRELQS